MKKLLSAILVLGTISSTSAMAKTEGNYIGLNLIRTNFQAKDVEDQSTGTIYKNNNGFGIKDENKVSAGINYKYAFSIDNFFIAPGVFYDHTNLSTRDNNRTEWKIDYRVGTKVDIGHDITDNFAIYGSAGFAYNAMVLRDIPTGYRDRGGNIAALLGLGTKFSVAEYLDLNLEYEFSKAEQEVTSSGKKYTQNFNIQVVRVGASYKF